MGGREMSPKVRIAGVSDVSLGLGSPQVLYFMRSVLAHYDAEGILIEPDQPEIHLMQGLAKGLNIHRIYSAFHPHQSFAGRTEYIIRSASLINKLRPDILILFCTFTLPVLFKLKTRPPFVIYYAYEMPFSYGELDVKMNRYVLNNSLVDLIIFPEENRAIQTLKIFGCRKIPIVILYNCESSIDSGYEVLQPKLRNGRILYAGTIDSVRTFAEYFFHEKMRLIPLDIFGNITGPDKENLRERFQKLCGGIRYLGVVNREKLKNVQKSYCYRVVMWNPVDDQHLYAAPNKFFEAIAAGVPPITAPHPQCKMLVRRYKCGIVMDDWSFDSFYEAIRQALEIYGTDKYDRMVENCRKAFVEELNWEKQFEKVKPFLKEVR
jgi:glycosyltransferase involved in cell wall biosynthesis